MTIKTPIRDVVNPIPAVLRMIFRGGTGSYVRLPRPSYCEAQGGEEEEGEDEKCVTRGRYGLSHLSG